MAWTQTPDVNSCTDSRCDHILILIDQLSIKISRKCLKWLPPGGTYEQSGTLCYQGLYLDLSWLLMLAPAPWLWRPWAARDTSLNSYHNHASSTNCPDKEVPIFRDSLRDEEHAFPQIVCWNIANRVWPLGCLLKKSFSAVAFWLHVQHRCLKSFIMQLLFSIYCSVNNSNMLMMFNSIISLIMCFL